MSARWPRRAAIGALCSAAVLLSCGTDPSAEDADLTVRFCAKNPRRDLGAMFGASARLPDGPAVTLGPGLVDYHAGGFDDVPAEVEADVDLVIARFRATQGASATLDEPPVRAAVDRTNDWMRRHCSPDPTPGTG